MRSLLAVVILSAGPLAAALAHEPGCCASCQQRCCLKPVCRLVCEPKIEVEVCYDCHCEDFCTMGPSKKCGEVCEPDACGHGHKKRTLWQPSCGHVRHRHVLVRHEIEREVPHYKCVVEYVCDRCCTCDGRVPCEQAGRLQELAAQKNAAQGQPQAAEAPASTSNPSRWSLRWPMFTRK
jgi:hypothetical protein